MNRLDFDLIKFLARKLSNDKEVILNLEPYPLFDKELALDMLQDEENISKLFYSVQESNKNDLSLLKKLYEEKDWIQARKIVDKLKDGLVFGLPKIYFALLFFEMNLTEDNQYRDALHAQLYEVYDQTISELMSKGLLIKHE